MLSTKTAAPFTVLLAVLSIAAFAQNPPTGQNQRTTPAAEEIIKKVREKYRYPRSYETTFTKTVEFKRERNGLVYESKVQTSASVWEESPDRSRVEARDSDYEIVKVVDGRIHWLYSPDFKMYVKREADAEGRPPRPANEEGRFDNLASEASRLIRQYASAGETARGVQQVTRLLREETLESGGQKFPCYVIELNQALPDKSDFKRLLWVEKDKFLVRREISTRTSQSAQGAKTVSATRPASTPAIPRACRQYRPEPTRRRRCAPRALRPPAPLFRRRRQILPRQCRGLAHLRQRSDQLIPDARPKLRRHRLRGREFDGILEQLELTRQAACRHRDIVRCFAGS